MRVRGISADGRTTVVAISGSDSVLLSLDFQLFSSQSVPSDSRFFGFDIRRSDGLILGGAKRFRDDCNNSSTNDNNNDKNSDFSLIQSFQWADYQVDMGKSYSYAVKPLFSLVQTCEQNDEAVANVTIQTESIDIGGADLHTSVHDVVFNRGIAGSQAYARRFGNLPPASVPERAAFKWLSHGLEESLIEFVTQTVALLDSNSTGGSTMKIGLRVAAYEFTYIPFLEALRDAAASGVDLKITYDSKCNSKGEPLQNVLDADQAIEASKLPRELLIRRTKAQISHNKFIIRLEDGTPTRIWTGSTNFTEGGIFGQSNVGHICSDRAIAARFLEYWNELATDPAPALFRKWNDLHSPLPRVLEPKTTHLIFSPRASDSALRLYAFLFASAKHTVCMTAAFGVTQFFRSIMLGDPIETTVRQRFLLLEKPPGNVELAAMEADSRNRIAIGAVLGSAPTADDAAAVDPASDAQPDETVAGASTNETCPVPTPAFSSFSRFLLGEAVSGLNDHVSFVHTKFMLVDPLSDDPIVICGSGNFSDASVQKNDENVLIIRGDRRLSDMLFTGYMRLWRHFYFRYHANKKLASTIRTTAEVTAETATDPMYLDETGQKWWRPYFESNRRDNNVRLVERETFARAWCPSDPVQAPSPVVFDETLFTRRLDQAADLATRKLRKIEMLDDSTFVLQFAYMRTVVDAVKLLPLSSFHAATKQWRIQKSADAVAALIIFRDRFQFGTSPEAAAVLGAAMTSSTFSDSQTALNHGSGAGKPSIAVTAASITVAHNVVHEAASADGAPSATTTKVGQFPAKTKTPGKEYRASAKHAAPKPSTDSSTETKTPFVPATFQ